MILTTQPMHHYEWNPDGFQGVHKHWRMAFLAGWVYVTNFKGLMRAISSVIDTTHIKYYLLVAISY